MTKTDTRTIGIDIGGANIKLSDGGNCNIHQPFALWQTPEKLVEEVSRLLNLAGDFDSIAVTMTGELTDCFANKQEGVHFIVDATCRAATTSPTFYQVGGSFVDSDQAKREYTKTAASNWHATTKFAAQSRNESAQGTNGILLDIGSTTTDIIPFANGNVVAKGHDDFDRLTNHELVYTGVVRSNLAGIVKNVKHRGSSCTVMNEMFATTADTNIVQKFLAPGSQDFYSADGMPTDPDSCVRRIARLIGKDDLTFGLQDAIELAKQVTAQQAEMIANAIDNVLDTHEFVKAHILITGQGEFLAEQVCQRIHNTRPVTYSRLTGDFTEDAASCASAWCIARLANQ